jgi:hypothetical protein
VKPFPTSKAIRLAVIMTFPRTDSYSFYEVPSVI